MRKSIETLTHLGIEVWNDFGGVLPEKSMHCGPKNRAKIDANVGGRVFEKNIVFLFKNNGFDVPGDRSGR